MQFYAYYQVITCNTKSQHGHMGDISKYGLPHQLSAIFSNSEKQLPNNLNIYTNINAVVGIWFTIIKTSQLNTAENLL